MFIKVILALHVCGLYSCLAIPAPLPKYDLPGDDETNWEELWNAIKNDTSVSRSDFDENVFDTIVGINARERGNGAGRSDTNVFLFEGDIHMNKSEVISLIQGSQGTSRQKRAVMKNNGRNLWRRYNIAYAIDSSLNHVQNNVRRGIAEWQNTLPCMGKWRDVTGGSKPRDYMYFFRGGGCYSQVGRVGGGQRVSIGSGCEQHGVVVHEIGHAMGLWHEQSRPDRDNYVSILWNNIVPAMKFNFQKHSTSRVNSLGIGYDYGSVMHYGAYAFSRYRGRKTIESKPRGKQLGQRYGLSSKDKQQVQLLYGCTKKPTKKPTVGPRPPSGCRGDLQSQTNCNYWRDLGYCHKEYVDYMKKNCCRTCSAVVKSCRGDKRRSCHYWKRLNYCVAGKYVKFMKENCCLTCGTR